MVVFFFFLFFRLSSSSSSSLSRCTVVFLPRPRLSCVTSDFRVYSRSVSLPSSSLVAVGDERRNVESPLASFVIVPRSIRDPFARRLYKVTRIHPRSIYKRARLPLPFLRRRSLNGTRVTLVRGSRNETQPTDESRLALALNGPRRTSSRQRSG